MRKLFVWISVLMFIPGIAKSESKRKNIFLTDYQIERAKEQLNNPELEISIKNLRNNINKNERNWNKIFEENKSYSIEEIFNIASKNSYRADLLSDAIAVLILSDGEKYKKRLREALLFEIGIHKNEGSWRELGIHQGERLCRYLEAFEMALRKNVLTENEISVIKTEIHQAARFLNAWTLESPINYIYQWQTYCFNIKFYPICMLGVIGMYFPEFEESKFWVEQANEQFTRLLLTENFIDGGYGENSIHYWSPTFDGVIAYLKASRNLGYKNYMDDLTFRRYFKKLIKWRIDLTATDGRKSAIGDAHRCGVGSRQLLDAAYLLDEPEFAWVVKSIHDRIYGTYNFEPRELLTYDASFKLKKPEYNYMNYIWSGYGIYRSGWDADDNYFMMKYGPTWAGRREIEKNPVIAGHSHQDCMEIEMLYKGIPMFVDPGYRGMYSNYETYGGFWKATISHNTVGLGNKYGYSRTDGKFDEHVKKHGKEFRYEQEQINIGMNDTRLMAFSDVENMTYLSAKATTYKGVEHQRSVLWFRDNSITIVYDELESEKKQKYEWYLNPIGKLLNSDKKGNATIGDDKAKLDIVDLKENSSTEFISQGTLGIPPYYAPFQIDFKEESNWDGPNARWRNYTMVVKKAEADTVNFFSALIPYDKDKEYKVKRWNEKGRIISSEKGDLYIAERYNSKSTNIDGDFGVIEKNRENKVCSYFVKDGYKLTIDNKDLLTTELVSTPWMEFYNHKTSAAVCLDSNRASIILDGDPWNEYVLIHNPKLVEGQEPALPIRVKVKFYTGKKPTKMIRERSNERIPELNKPEYDEAINKGNFFKGLKNYGVIEARMSRVNQIFEYDENSGMVTVILPPGFNHLVWE